MVGARRVADWIYSFVLFPLGQILAFIAGAALVMMVLAYGLTSLSPDRDNNIILLFRQLPGMITGGVTIGFVYAMIALGYTMVYGVLKFINFAHSEIFMVGSVVAFEVMTRIHEAGEGIILRWNPVVLVIVMAAAAMLVSGSLAVAVERVAYRPLRGAPRLVPLISAIGVSLFLIDLVRAIMALSRNAFNLTYPKNDIPWLNTPAFTMTFEGAVPVNIQWTRVIIIVGAVIMLVALNYFVNGTKLGRGIRAVSQDQTTAALMGIDVNRMIALTFFIGGAFGGAAGALFGLNVGTVTPTVGFIPGIKAFTAAVLGGIGNVPGALLGGITLGMVETFLNGILGFFPGLGKQYTDIFAFLVLILILIFRPGGILGEHEDQKV